MLHPVRSGSWGGLLAASAVVAAILAVAYPISAQTAAAPTFVSKASRAGTSKASTAIPAPSGMANNDILVAVVYTEPASRVITTAPAGFAALTSVVAPDHRMSIYWKRAASESGSYTFRATGATWMGGNISVFRGAALTGVPFDVIGTGSTGVSSTPTAPGITTTLNDDLLLFVSTNWDGRSYTPPAGMTERFDNNAGSLATLPQAIGATGAKTATMPQSAEWAAIQLSLKSANPTPSGPKMTLTSPANGQSVSAASFTATYTTSGDLAGAGVHHAHLVLDGVTTVMDIPMDHAYTFSNVAPGPHTLTGFLVRIDHSYIAGTDSPTISFQTVAPDMTPPTVSVTAPASGAAVSGTTTAAATASDDTGVAGVQFFLDGATLGTEDVAAPFSISWDAGLYSAGAHVMTARARDVTGNMATSAPVNFTITNPLDPALIGQWTAATNWPVVGVHSVLMSNGKVLVFEGLGIDGQGVPGGVFNPATGAFRSIPDPVSDIFCAGHAVLADGRILVVGGHTSDGHLGITDVNIFNPVTETWSSAPPMHYRRWYPMASTLPDGRVLVVSGSDLSDYDYVPYPEIYNPVTNSWTVLSAANLTVPAYPQVTTLLDGTLAISSAERKIPALKLNVATQTWTTLDPTVLDGGPSVMYDYGKFLKSGSTPEEASPLPLAAKTSYVIDYNAPAPVWTRVGDMEIPRFYHGLTLLPDGNVIVSSGSQTHNKANPVLEIEMWSPTTQQWTTMARGGVPRTYHSGALLMPDGRVLISGSGRLPGQTDYRNYEYYSPPYLFKGARPTISAAPDVLSLGTSFFVGTPDAATVTSAVMIRNGSFTHETNSDQRRIPLTFSQTSGGLTVNAPANGNYAPPGFYMLFLLNANGVPSVAKIVRVPAPYEDFQAPTAPTGLGSLGAIGTVALNWTASTDNFAVHRYNIHRATTPGLVPTVANRVGQSTTTSFVNQGIPAGQYYYVVTAEDANGNISPPSNETSAIVVADVTPPTVSMTAPNPGAALAGTATLSASANDDVGIAGVQFLLDGAPILAEVQTAPYNLLWPTAGTTNGPHQLSAKARDTGGNETISTPVGVTVSNVGAAAPTYRSSSVAPGAAKSSLSFTAPVGLANNDIMLALVYSEAPGTALTTIPSGFALLSTVQGPTHRMSLYWKRAASETGSYTFAATGATWTGGVMVAFQGAATSGMPFETVGPGASGSSTTPTAPSISATQNDDLLLFVSTNFDGRSYTPPSGMTERVDVSSGTVATALQSIGATGSKSATIAASDSWNAQLFLLKSATPTP